MEPLPWRSSGTFVAETRFSGSIVTTAWPRETVERLLPPGLRLARQQSTPRAAHPVVFIFGEHDLSAVRFASLRITTGVTFPELVIAIPFVRRKDENASLFLSQVFSGEPVVTWSGNVHYGFAKRMVPMERLGDSFVVKDERGALLVHATTEPVGAWQGAEDANLPGLASLTSLGRLPVLGYRADGIWVSCRFDWRFTGTRVRPVCAIVSIDSPLGDQLGPQVCYAKAVDSFDVRGMGWLLSWPDRSA
jgi:hypothetical protein